MSNIIQTFPKGSGGGHVVLDTNGTAVDQEKKLQFTGLDVSDDSTNEKTEVKAVGLNADSLDDIIQSASVQGNAVAGNGLVYSTTEQVVGKWIDGKPIYQKTVSCGELPNNTTKNISHGISHLKRVLSFNGYAYNPTTENIRCLPFVGIDASNSNSTRVYFNTTNIALGSVGDTSKYTESYVTLQYTKTTD